MPYPLSSNPAKAWQYKQIPNFLGGLNTSSRTDMLEDTQTLVLRNVLIQRGVVGVDTGYKEFGSAVAGIPQGEFQFLRLDGLTDQLLITTASLYKYSSTHLQWQLVKGTASTTVVATLTGSFPAGSNNIDVASAAGFATGDLIGIGLASGAQHQATIIVTGTNFVLSSPIPSGQSAAHGGVVVRGVVLAGTLAHRVSATLFAGNNWFVFTNGVNIPMRYDTVDCVVVPNLPSAGNTVCAAVATYNSALFLLNTTEGGTNYPQRVRRSNQTDPTEWVLGTAGYDDLLDSADVILCGLVLGPYLIIYRTRAIYRGEFIGVGGLNYRFDPMISDEGPISASAVVDMSDKHILIGHANVYEYRGDFALTPIGSAIYPRLFDTHSDVNPRFESRIFAFYVEELDEIWIFYPSVNSEVCNKTLRYNVPGRFWYEREFNDSINGYGFFQLEESFTWDDLVGSWDQQNWKWDSRKMLQQAPTTHLLAATEGQVFEYDYYTVLDNGAAIGYTIESKDFVIPDADFRFDMIEMQIQGLDILLEYSTDEGETWVSLAIINMPVRGKHQEFKQFVTHSIRFRWSSSIGSNFRLDWAGFSYKIESLYPGGSST